MIIDHIGYVLFPSQIILRVIGRMAFPIFAYHLVVGYKNTSNHKNYVARLSIFAIVSQIPFSYFGGGLNIFFTLILGILAIYLLERNKTVLLIIVLLSSIILRVDYGLYGVLTPLLFFIFFDNRKKFIISFIALNLLYFIDTHSYIQLFSILSLPLIFKKWKLEVRLNRYFYYAFYPVHIALLLIVNNLVR